MKSKRIGLLGFGNIGQGVWKIISKRQSDILKRFGCSVDIVKILVRNKEKYLSLGIPEDKLTVNIKDILDDDGIDIVVELIGGVNPAYEYIKEAILKGKHVVTANKAVMALHGSELIQLAERQGVLLRFEGSVGGGIPVIGALTQSLKADEIEEIVGIVNGTTNYILTGMTKNGLSFDEALKLAQEKGYAEADPSSDIEGEDAAFKLAILADIAFNVQVSPDQIPIEGITKVAKKDIEYATDLGYTIKLLVKARKNNKTLELHVHPSLTPSDHPLAAVSDEFNAIYVTGDSVGQLMFYGKGAGSLPTGSAVVNDLLNIIMLSGKEVNCLYPPRDEKKLEVVGETECKYYIRLQVLDRPGVLGLITTVFGKYSISLASVVQRGKGEDVVPVVFTTHKTKREGLNRALEELKNYKEVDEIASILRVESFR